MLFDNRLFFGCVKSVLCCSMASKDVETPHPPASAATSTENTTASSSSSSAASTTTTETTANSSSEAGTSSSSGDSTTSSAPSTSFLSSTSAGSDASTTDDGTTYSSRSRLFSSPITYSLKEGEFLHDSREGDKTLMEYVNHIGAMNVFDIFLDYTRVITQDCKQAATTFNKNESFNRYQDIRCIETTRVKIASTEDGNDYIHANYVDGFRETKKYILTQAPFHSTLEKFCEMIWQEKSTTIVSLTALDGEKVPLFIPPKSGETFIFGKIKIVNMGTRHIRDAYDATVLMVTKGDEPARKLLHIAFYTWPEKGTPTHPTEILRMIDDMNFNRKLLIEEAKKAGWLPNVDMPCSPIIVHCLIGVGRSGALVATEICLRKLDYSYHRTCGPCVDVRDTVLRLRTQRAMAVQKPEQYLFIHLAVLEYAVRKRYFDSIEDVHLDLFLYRKPKK